LKCIDYICKLALYVLGTDHKDMHCRREFNCIMVGHTPLDSDISISP
jgi:hypothetical protein